MHNYHDTFNTFPPGWITSAQPSTTGVTPELNCWSWGAMVLPYMDQAPLYNLVQPGTLSIAQNLAAGGAQSAALTTPLPAFRCASDVGPALNDFKGGTYGIAADAANLNRYSRLATSNGTDRIAIATSNYVIISDGDQSGTPAWLPTAFGPPLGIGFCNSKIGLRDITDGSSNQIMLAERAFKIKDLDIGAGNALGFGMTGTDVGNYARTSLAIHGIPYWGINQTVIARSDQTRSFSSNHVGGTHVVLGDGSVRFLSDSIDHKPATGVAAIPPAGTYVAGSYVDGTLERLCARNDGQVLGEF